MEKISKEDAAGMLPIKRGRDTKLRGVLLTLEVGEAVFLPKEEWKRKNTPYYVVARIKKTHGFLYEYGMKLDNSGWLFRRKA